MLISCSVCGPVAHVGLHQLEHLAGLLLDGAVAGDEHGLLDGAAVPGEHVGDGDPPAEEALRVQVQVLAGPVHHVDVRAGLAQGGVWVLVAAPDHLPATATAAAVGVAVAVAVAVAVTVLTESIVGADRCRAAGAHAMPTATSLW